MGKKKIALIDLSQGEKAQLKATGVRSQKLTFKADKPAEPEYKSIEIAEDSKLKPEAETIAKTPAKTKKHIRHGRSKRYLSAKAKIKLTAYPLTKAIKLLRELSPVKFDASVELHLNLNSKKLAGEVSLPHGTGKTLRIEIASEKTLVKLNDDRIDFDVLIAAPAMMPKLAKYAKILGPKGLMPNPKNGTISPDPEAAAKKFSGGLVHFKSEPKAPLIHLVIGKISFKDSQLEDNLKAIITAVKPANIAAAYICSSMSPSVKLEIK